MYRGTFAVVDERAIANNVQHIRRQLEPSVRMLVAVKANGYGHGAPQVARTVLSAGATDLGVASLEEALELREAGITAPILVLGRVSPYAARTAARFDVAITVTDDWSTLDVVPYEVPLKVHFKIETGMNRLGFQSVEEVERVIRYFNSRSDVVCEGLFTHLACADATEKAHASAQIDRFNAFIEDLTAKQICPPLIHAANSAATLSNPAWHYNMVRVGISAYGYKPDPGFDTSLPLTPALHLYSFISRIKKIQAGESVGYGATFVAQKPTWVATVPIGYADGYPRYLSNRASVLIGNERAPIIGNVCMDQFMVDITNVSNVQVGDCVTAYGRSAPDGWSARTLQEMSPEEAERVVQRTFREADNSSYWITLDELAGIGHTISYEVMCALSLRVPRIYVQSL